MSRRRTIAVSLALCTLFLSGCVTVYNPATERREMLFISTPWEVSLGQDMAAQVERKYKVLRDPEMQQRLDRIGSRIAAACDRQDVTYRFQIVDDKELNAFALPGGFVYVNGGLMRIANDDELAGVLAHEVGHVAARHSAKRLQSVLGYQLLSAIVFGIAGKAELAKATDVVYNLIDLGYSRGDEFTADELAVKYTLKAGYDPQGMVTFFGTLNRDAEERGSAAPPVFLSSHPPIDERIKHVESLIHASAVVP